MFWKVDKKLVNRMLYFLVRYPGRGKEKQYSLFSTNTLTNISRIAKI
jgi:hypothetical protein